MNEKYSRLRLPQTAKRERLQVDAACCSGLIRICLERRRGDDGPACTRYHRTFTPSCIVRLPPVNCLSLRNRGEVTFEYVVLRALSTVPIRTPV